MHATFDRRDFLAATAGGIAAAALPWPALAEAPERALTVRPLGGNLALIEGAGANVVVATTPTEVLLVDGGLPERAADLLGLIAERWPDRRLATLFNTNWRPEHTGANSALRSRGARIIAHENTKLWLGGDFTVDWEKKDYRPQPIDALPNATFYESGALDFAGETVEYAHLPRAHTDGDLYVHFRRANMLVASDVLAVGAYPIVDYSTGGWIGGLEQATQTLLEIVGSDTQIVPAVGAPQGVAALRDQLALCTTVRERLAQAFRSGMSLKDFAATEPTKEFDAARGDPAQFLALVYKGAWGHIRELGGVI
jgi:glyoxylase-like metal-dependent hydrolase (beta-lactamase superfamily II)